MAGHSVPIDLRVDSDVVHNPDARGDLLDKLKALVEPYSGPLRQVAFTPLPAQNYQALYAADSGNTLSIKIYKNGLVSAVFEHYTEDIHKQVIGLDESMKLEERIISDCKAKSCKVLPGIKRSPPINPYYSTSDDRILEYDVDKLVFREKTPFQCVEIYHTKSFGNILFLDNLQNLGESDLPYTHGLMNKGIDCYKDKTVLILGGGDGALMRELLREDPKFVTMIDIDEAVMRSCKAHLRNACGTALDSFKGSNYETIVGDALVYMETYIKEGKLFDYVFADLTDVPISKEPVGDIWNFLGQIMAMGTKLIKPGTGRYMTHAIGVQCTEALRQFEEKLLSVEVGASEVTRTSHYVPSFMEKWCFFQLTRKPLGFFS